MKKLTFTLFLFVLVNLAYGQTWTRLAEITEGTPTSPGGLGQVFFGEVMSDGNLYFRGSGNGSRKAIWKTDGTVAGTNKVVEEANTFGYNWDQIFMTEVGVLINEDDVWKILQPGNTSFTTVSGLPAETIHRIARSTDDDYFVTTQRDGQYILFSANSTLTSFTEIGAFHSTANFMELYSGTEGAIIFSSDAFVGDSPKVYLTDSGEMQGIGDYLSSLSLTLNTFTYGYIYDKFMFVSFKDDNNFFQHKVIDMSSGQVEDFQFIREPVDYYEYDGEIIIITETEVVSFDPATMTHQELFDDVYPFTVSAINGDKVYCIGDNNNNEQNIVEVDLTNGTANFLPGALTGLFHYNCKMVWYQDEFYYLNRGDYTVLMKYNFNTNEPEEVHTLSETTGATIGHALEVVNDELVASIREGFIQHELYVAGDGGVSSTSNINVKQLEAYPTIANEFITLGTTEDLNIFNDVEVTIIDSFGKVARVSTMQSDRMNVADLTAGVYVGIISLEGEVYQFRFVKE
ncbi:MAG: T9SS C-terminal target domain-containing protein [Bacteroidetes bacterium]|nr:MAG: T9SS C-terminal target domain-containing protein [Bacteroidota bacterium]